MLNFSWICNVDTTNQPIVNVINQPYLSGENLTLKQRSLFDVMTKIQPKNNVETMLCACWVTLL
jgi:hypothetical protein